MFISQIFALVVLLAIIAGVLVISTKPLAFVVMSIAFTANVLVIVYRLYWPTIYDLHIVAVSWLIIAMTLGTVVTQAVFRPGRVTYHRIVGAVLLYLLIAVTFSMLFALVGISFPGAFGGMTFEYNSSVSSRVLYFSFVTLTSTGYGDVVPIHPFARSLSNLEAIIGQLYPAILLARLVTLELSERPQSRPTTPP